MTRRPAHPPPPGRALRWFGLLGGAFAWLAHLLLAYAIAEFGCAGVEHPPTFLGVTAIAWALLILTAVLLLVALASAAAARRSMRRPPDPAPPPCAEAERLMARAGLILDALFCLIILAQAVPIFFYLQDC